MGIFIKRPIALQKSVKHIEWGRPKKLVPILFPSSAWLFPLESHPVVYFIICEMHVFSHQFPIT